MDKATANKMLALWSGAAERDVGELWQSITSMTDDPIEAADLLAEAGQRDESVAIPVEVLDEIHTVAIDAAGTEPVEQPTVKNRLFAAMKRAGK